MTHAISTIVPQHLLPTLTPLNGPIPTIAPVMARPIRGKDDDEDAPVMTGATFGREDEEDRAMFGPENPDEPGEAPMTAAALRQRITATLTLLSLQHHSEDQEDEDGGRASLPSSPFSPIAPADAGNAAILVASEERQEEAALCLV